MPILNRSTLPTPLLPETNFKHTGYEGKRSGKKEWGGPREDHPGMRKRMESQGEFVTLDLQYTPQRFLSSKKCYIVTFFLNRAFESHNPMVFK